MTRRRLAARIAAGAFAGLLASASPAAEAPADSVPLPVYRMDPVYVEGKRIPLPTGLPGARTVLDRAWLESHDPMTVAAALRPVPGLRVRTAGDGLSAFASARGLGSERVAVLVDGRPLNSAQGGGVDLGPLDIEGVERVEVMRGSQGALYGPDALGGAVNLVRRTSRDSYLELRGLGGTEDRGMLRAGFGLRGERVDLEGTLQGATASPDLDGLAADARNLGAWSRLAWHPTWAASLELGGEFRGDRRDVPGTTAFPSPEAEREDRYGEGYAALRGADVAGGAFDLELTRSRLVREYRDPAAPLGAVDDRHANDRWRGAAGWTATGTAGTLRTRVEATRDRLASTTDGDVSRDRAAIAVSGSIPRGTWALAPALRLDAVEGFAPEGSARLTLTRFLHRAEGTSVALRLGGGTGFRPPTFDDLFWPARASAAGNPDLEPERAYDLDLGAVAETPDLRGEITGFLTRVESMILWTPGADGVWRPSNVGAARLAGLEVGALGRTSLGGVPADLDLAYTFLDARDATDDPVTGGKRLVGRTPHHLTGEALLRPGRFTVGGGFDGVGSVPLTAANTKSLDGYVLFHAMARYRVNDALRLDVELRNLADTRYEDLRGYGTPGRELLLGFRYVPGGTP